MQSVESIDVPFQVLIDENQGVNTWRIGY